VKVTTAQPGPTPSMPPTCVTSLIPPLRRQSRREDHAWSGGSRIGQHGSLRRRPVGARLQPDAADGAAELRGHKRVSDTCSEVYRISQAGDSPMPVRSSPINPAAALASGVRHPALSRREDPFRISQREGTMKRAISLTVALALLMSAVLGAQERAPLIADVRSALIGRDAISVRLQSGEEISGPVTYRTADGFYVARPPRAPRFVQYASIDAILDPLSGAVEARVRPAWSRAQVHRHPALGIAVIFFTIMIATRGMIAPGCWFADCR